MTGLRFVLIPGAGGAAWYWHRLEPELRRRGHAAIAVGLPADDDAAGLLVGRDDRFFPVECQHRVARERLGIVPDEMPGGHLVALSRPAALAERLVAYAESAQAGDSPGAAR